MTEETLERVNAIERRLKDAGARQFGWLAPASASRLERAFWSFFEQWTLTKQLLLSLIMWAPIWLVLLLKG